MSSNDPSRTLFVLGAADPEMQTIESVLCTAGTRFAHATVGGVRVHPGNAYKADWMAYPGPVSPGRFRLADLASIDRIVLVECGGSGEGASALLAPGKHIVDGRTVEVVRIDHHRHDDPGYGKGPEEFLSASSIGQVWSLLRVGAEFIFAPAVGDDPDEWLWKGPHGAGPVPAEIVLCAAADHCLEATYRGRCPGVDPDALMRWRTESRAAFQKRSVEAMLADVADARDTLRNVWEDQICQNCLLLREDHIGGRCGLVNEEDDTPELPEYADLRGQHIPELPEAACREGIPFLSTVRDRDGREKVVLQAAPPDLVRRFLAGEIVPGLKDTYGDPARGFAGGYLS